MIVRRKVSRIVKSFSNAVIPFPVAWLELECNHTAPADAEFGRAHDDSAHRIKPGDVVDCRHCESYARSLTKLNAIDPSTVSHTRFRAHDSRGIGSGDVYVYGRDSKSPTGCHLLMSIDDTPEVQQIIRARFGNSPLSPTESR